MNKSVYERLKKKANIPEEYFSYKISDYNFNDKNKKPDLKKTKALKTIVDYCDNFDENFKNGKGMYIYGPAKSHLGITLLGTFILRQGLNKCKKCKFVEFPTFLINISSYSDEFKVEETNEYYTTDILMIDSINAFQYLNNTRVKTMFADIVFQRRNNNKPIIFSSHCEPEMLSIMYCDTLTNFVESHCGVVDLSIPSIRMITLVEARSRLDNFARHDPGRDMQRYHIEEISKIILDH